MSWMNTAHIALLERFLDVNAMRQSIVTTNVANVDTPGFRRRRLQFQDLIYQNLVAPGAAATQQTTFPTGLQIGLGSTRCCWACSPESACCWRPSGCTA